MKKTSLYALLIAAVLALLLAACGSGTADAQTREIPIQSAQTENEAVPEAPEPEANEPAVEASAAAEAVPADAQPEAAEPETEPEADPETEPEDEAAQPIVSDAEAEPEAAPTREGGSETPDGSGDASNFNTYDDKSQQETSDKYVLNTNTKKIHNPWCSSVSRISPKNYATTNKSVEELEAEGYTRCGQKGDWN